MATSKKSKTFKLESKQENYNYKANYMKVKKIYLELESKKNLDPSSSEVQILISKYLQYLSSNHKYCLSAFRELGNLYETNISLQTYLNSYGDGFSNFLSQAIKVYCA